MSSATLAFLDSSMACLLKLSSQQNKAHDFSPMLFHCISHKNPNEKYPRSQTFYSPTVMFSFTTSLGVSQKIIMRAL